WLRPLFKHFFELLIDHLAGEPINRHVQPVPLFPFDHKLRKTRGSRRITPRLRDYVDHQIPSPRLTGVTEGTQYTLTCFFIPWVSRRRGIEYCGHRRVSHQGRYYLRFVHHWFSSGKSNEPVGDRADICSANWVCSWNSSHCLRKDCCQDSYLPCV